MSVDFQQGAAQEVTQQVGAYGFDYYAQALHAVRHRSDGTLRECFRDQPLPPLVSI